MADAGSSSIVPLVSVVIGGCLTLSGQWFLSRQQSGREAERRRSDKFEELVEALFEHKHWLDVIRDVRAFGKDGAIPPTPLPKAQAIAAVYFPDFDERIDD